MLTHFSQYFNIILKRLGVQHIIKFFQMRHPLEADKIIVSLFLGYVEESCKFCDNCNYESKYIGITI